STYYYRVSAVNTNWSSTLSNVAWNSYCWSIDNDGGIFEDDFNDDLMDTTKWYKGILSVDTSAYNSGVTVLEQNQRLEIIPIANTSVPSYNGYVSENSYNFIGGRASVQVPQIPTVGQAMAIFTF